MSRLIQYQRRAIEKVVDLSDEGKFVLVANQEYILSNSVIFLAGVSEGVGTCSDLHNVNVAVFTKNPKDKGRVKFLDPDYQIICEGAVLLRDRRKGESSPDIHPACSDIEAVDGLCILHKFDHPKRIFFKPNGRSALYVQLVSS